MDEIAAVYNAIRAQSLAAKEQRFRLYYWKILSVLIFLGLSISKRNEFFDVDLKSLLIAIVLPALVVMFDLSIRSRSLAIKRDGKVLKGLESAIATRTKLKKSIFPETYYDLNRENYWTSDNRQLETLPQYLFSISAIAIGYVVYFVAHQSHNHVLAAIEILFISGYFFAIWRLYFPKKAKQSDENSTS